jgi:pimeloyl-ACP methyl ester carboxylesterase
METYASQIIRTNGVHLHTIVAGDPHGEPVILLHGFPEFWYGWRHQIPFLVEQGYRVIVPDQRGYNLSDKPENVEEYRISVLATDIEGLIDHFGYDKVLLVGHDWGGAVAWWVATMFPQRLKKLAVLNTPYPTIMLEQMRGLNMRQLAKSWYMFFFQLPTIPERVLRSRNYSGFARSVFHGARPDTFTAEEIEQYIEAWRKPGALTAMLNWYRATGRGQRRMQARATAKERIKIAVPTLMLWGEKDAALGKELARPSIELCQTGRLIYFPKATHWIHHDEPAAVNQRLLEFWRE